MSVKDKTKEDFLSEAKKPVSDSKSEHEKRLKRYSAAKAHQLLVIDYLRDNEPKLKKERVALEDCGGWLVFRHWYTVNEYRLISGCSCKKHLLCRLCAIRRSAKLVMAHQKRITQVMSENPHLIPVLITRTVRNGEDLGERYRHLTGSHKKLIQRRRDALKKKTTARGKKSVMRYVHGSAGSIEFKRGKDSGDWHPHSHEIALLEPVYEFTEIYKSATNKTCMKPLEFESALAHEWLAITGDSHIVDVRRIDASTPEKLLDAIAETFKYTVKPDEDTELADQVHAYKTLKTRRLIFSYGSLWGVKIPDEVTDAIEDELKLLPYVDLMYKFVNGKYGDPTLTDLGPLHQTNDEKRNDQKRRSRRITTKNNFVSEDFPIDQAEMNEWVTEQQMYENLSDIPPF